MNLGDLLDEIRHGILRDVSNQVAGPTDQLWSDARLVRYINEAQRRFARKALVIRDSTTAEATQVTLVTGTETYSLHPAVLAVLSVRLTGDPADLARAGHSALDTYQQPDPYFFDPSQLTGLPAGKPLAYATDETLAVDDHDSLSVVTLRVYPVPPAAYDGQVLRLRVVRLPLEDLCATNLYAVPEVPADHHLEMLDWAAYLALRIVDADAGFPARAAEFRASFELAVTEARKSAMRKLFAPAQWGFGRNGFTWER